MNLAEFLKIYRYGRKSSTFTGWLILKRDKPIGDCEDYALTCAFLAYGRSRSKLLWKMTIGECKFFFVDSLSTTSQKPRHTIVRIKGYGWYDSNFAGERCSRTKIWNNNRKIFRWPTLVAWGMIAWGGSYQAAFGNTSEPTDG